MLPALLGGGRSRLCCYFFQKSMFASVCPYSLIMSICAPSFTYRIYNPIAFFSPAVVRSSAFASALHHAVPVTARLRSCK